MIRLEITGESANEFAQNLTTVAALLNAQLNTVAATPTAPAAASAKPSRGKSQNAPAKEDTAASSAQGATQESTATTSSSGPTATNTASPSEPVTRESVAKKCTVYGQPNKGGVEALKQLFIEMGSEQGKFSGVPEENLPSLNARLDELLAE